MKLPLNFSSTALGELLQKCSSTPKPLSKARQIHAIILATTNHFSPPFLNNNLITLYAKSGAIVDAFLVFHRMPTKNLVSYSAIISACSRTPPYYSEALKFLPEILSVGLQPNGLALASLLHASLFLHDSIVGSMIHSLVVRYGFVHDGCVQTALLMLYSECGFPNNANKVFAEMGYRDVIAWNGIIFANLKSGDLQNGLRLFSNMMKDALFPSEFTFSMVFSACRRLTDQRSGEIVHGLLTKLDCLVDVPLQNALLDMYSSWGDLNAAMVVFREIKNPVLISWNSLISGLSDNGDAQAAMYMFVQLRAVSSAQMQPDEYTYAAIVSATAHLPAAFHGKPLHSQVEKVGLSSSVFVGSTFIDMYFKNQEPESACKIFNFILHKDVIVWTGMIVGYSQSGEGETALFYFYNMTMEGHRVDSFSLSSILKSCADLATLKQGELVHSQVVRTGYEVDMCVSGSLIDMYAKNGDLRSAQWLFDRVCKPDLKCWNAMLGGYGNHGDAELAFTIFNGMIGSGLKPDHVTFVSLLSACSHCCLVEKGRFYWSSMRDHALLPERKHYSCMINLLSRGGLLREAEELIIKSPCSDFPELWRILLSSCVNFKDLEMGTRAAKQVLALEPDDSSTFVMLSNLYASVQKWEGVSMIRRRLRGMMLEKDPGLSWIEIKDRSHVFSADDEYHEHVDNARDELRRLRGNMKGWEVEM